MQRLTLVAPASSYTGYGLHAHEIIRWMDMTGVFVSLRAIHTEENFGARLPELIRQRIVKGPQPEPWEILLAPPHIPTSPGKRVLYFTMHESTRLPDANVKLLNKAAAIAVPCHWNKEVFERCGVERQIHVVPLGIDEAVFNYQPMNMTGPCVFGAAGRLAHGVKRKGVLDVIDLFLEAFPGDEQVELHVKVHPDCPVPNYTEWPWLKITREHMPESGVAAWLKGITAFVTLSAGEGWGLWQHQAAAVGRPVVGCIYGGLREYLGDTSAYPVAYTEGGASDGYTGDWAIADRTSLVWQMREVYKNREKAMAIGVEASRSASRFTWKSSIDRLLDVYESVRAGKRVSAPSWTPCKKTFEPMWAPSADRQLLMIGLEHGRFEFPDKDRLYFNTSVVTVDGKRLLFSRSAIKDGYGNRIDNRIEVHEWGPKRIEKVTEVRAPSGDWVEDPRILKLAIHPANETGLYLSYTQVDKNMAKQCFADLLHDFQIGTPHRVDYGKNGSRGPEKNWTWFYDGNGSSGWSFIYELKPHTVVRVSWDGKVDGVLETRTGWDAWSHGRPRGGTSPVKVGGEWFAIFHSSLPWLEYHRKYFAGAYAFSAEPPYHITRITPAPLLYGTPNDPRMGVRHSNVFPMGALHDNGEWLVTMGVNDECSMWFKMSHEWLLSRMVDVI